MQTTHRDSCCCHLEKKMEKASSLLASEGVCSELPGMDAKTSAFFFLLLKLCSQKAGFPQALDPNGGSICSLKCSKVKGQSQTYESGGSASFPFNITPVSCSSLLQDFFFRSRDYHILIDATCKWLENKC